MFDMESSVNCHASNGNKQNHVSILKLVLLSRSPCTTELHFETMAERVLAKISLPQHIL